MSIKIVETRPLEIRPNLSEGISSHPNYMWEGRLFDHLNGRLTAGEGLGARIITEWMRDITISQNPDILYEDDTGLLVGVPYKERLSLIVSQPFDRHLSILPQYLDLAGKPYDGFVAMRLEKAQLKLEF